MSRKRKNESILQAAKRHKVDAPLSMERRVDLFLQSMERRGKAETLRTWVLGEVTLNQGHVARVVPPMESLPMLLQLATCAMDVFKMCGLWPPRVIDVELLDAAHARQDQEAAEMRDDPLLEQEIVMESDPTAEKRCEVCGVRESMGAMHEMVTMHCDAHSWKTYTRTVYRTPAIVCLGQGAYVSSLTCCRCTVVAQLWSVVFATPEALHALRKDYVMPEVMRVLDAALPLECNEDVRGVIANYAWFG